LEDIYMASGFCTYLKNKLVGHLHGAAYTQPTHVYVGLCTSVAADGTITGEPSGNGYARVEVDNNNTTATWGAASNGAITNSAAIIQFPACDTNGWGALDTFFVSDNSTGNTNTLYWGDLTTEITVAVGDQPTFNTSQLTVTIS
jgi:hypothetical protein